MHGHRALADVRDAAVAAGPAGLSLTLLCDVDWRDGSESLSAVRAFEPDGTMTWRVNARGLGRDEALFVRHPFWGSMHSGRREVHLVPEAGGEMLAAADGGSLDATLRVTPRLRFVRRDGTGSDLGSSTARVPTEGASSAGRG